MLSNIHEAARKLCDLILLWVTITVRLLSFANITSAIKSRIDEDSDVGRTARRHVKLYEPLLEEVNGTLCLIHHSARAFFYNCLKTTI